MPGFSVTVPTVDALSFRVATAASDIRSAQGVVLSAGCVDAGYADLSGALSSFGTFWQQFTQDVSSQVDSAAQTIAAAAVSYQSVDSTVMVSPALTTSVVKASLSGNDAMLQLLVAPMLPNATAPVAPAAPFPLASTP